MANFIDEPVSVQITRMKALSSLDRGSEADFRSVVTMAGQRSFGRTFSNDDDISPGNDWNFTVSSFDGLVPITIEIFDDDGNGGFNPDDRVDINPLGGIRDLNLFFSLSTGLIFDGDNGNQVIGNVGESITLGGDKNGDNGEITFRIDGVPGPESTSSALSQGNGFSDTPESNETLGLDLFGNSALVTGDFDLDGRDDLAVDVGSERSGPVTHVAYGSSSGLSRFDTQNFTRPNSVFGPDASALAVGDIDGNGVDDLVIGGSNPVVRFGSTFTPLLNSQSILQSPTYPDNIAFGEVLTTGDFNGDGRDDIATSAHFTGAVQINYGSSSGIRNDSSRQVFTRDTPGILGTADTSFGDALAAGDVNGDGFDDLIIGVPNSIDIERAGTFHVLYGRSNGLSATNSQLIGQFFGGVDDQAGDRFGGTVAVGDVNGDGVDDVVVAATGRNSGAGAVYVYEGSQGQNLPFTNPKILTKSSLFGGASLPGDIFGSSLEVKDINGDGFDEIVIGAPGSNNNSDNNTGTVHVTFGSSTGPTSTVRVYRQGIEGIAGTPEVGDQFGRGVAVGNFDGAGAAEIAASVPFEDLGDARDAGMINIITEPIFNSSSNLTISQSTRLGSEGSIRSLAERNDDIVNANPNQNRMGAGAETDAIAGLEESGLIAGGLGHGFTGRDNSEETQSGDRNQRKALSQIAEGSSNNGIFERANAFNSFFNAGDEMQLRGESAELRFGNVTERDFAGITRAISDGGSFVGAVADIPLAETSLGSPSVIEFFN
ncbi:MAG: FG-GAP-like repeat-containing protein [Cyanobacteria bacterium J06642_2]